MTRGRHRVRSGLVVVQVALSLTLLFAAGLLGRSFTRLVRVDPGFEPEGLVALELGFGDRYTPSARAHGACAGWWCAAASASARSAPWWRAGCLHGGPPASTWWRC